MSAQPNCETEPKPFWPKCGLCGLPIQTKAEAKEIWVGYINTLFGRKGYIHDGGNCLYPPTK